jgi:hypothetical protein
MKEQSMTMYSDPDPRRMSPDARDQMEAAKRLAAERAEQAYPQATPAPPQEASAPQQARKRLSWAQQLHEQYQVTVTGPDHLALASHEYDQAVKGLEAAKERLENSEQSLGAARLRAESETKEEVRQAAEKGLRALRDRVAALHAKLAKLHQTLGGPSKHTTGRGPLGEIARTILSSWDPKRRTRSAELNRAAQEMSSRIAAAYQTTEKALKAFDLATTRGWGLEDAEARIKTAALINPDQIKADALALINEWEQLRKPANTRENANPPIVPSYIPEDRPEPPQPDTRWNKYE